MSLAIPGKIESICEDDPLQRVGAVSFDGLRKPVNLTYVPEATIGDYVLVHVGIAISKIQEGAAQQTLDDLKGATTDETP